MSLEWHAWKLNVKQLRIPKKKQHKTVRLDGKTSIEFEFQSQTGKKKKKGKPYDK